jgi:hypothetical protein
VGRQTGLARQHEKRRWVVAAEVKRGLLPPRTSTRKKITWRGAAMALLADASNSALISAIFCGVRVEGRSFQGGVKNARWRGGRGAGLVRRRWRLTGCVATLAGPLQSTSSL